MFIKNIGIVRVGIVFSVVVLSLSFFVETASAQFFRRQIRRTVENQLGPEYRTTPPADRPLLREPLIQGDGRFLERAQKVVGIFAGNGGAVELKPVVIVSFASFEEFKRVVQIVAEKIRLSRGSTEEPVLLNDFLEIYGRIVGQGFDRNQPVGLVLQTDGILYYPLFFTPLNLDGELGQAIKREYMTQLPDGNFVVRQEVFNWPLGPLYLRSHNGWAFIASETQLNALPDDPTVLLQGLDKEHLVAARFDLANLPALSTRAALTLGEMQAVAKVETDLEKAMARLGIGYIRSLAEQADFLEYTISYDEENNDYVVQQTEIVKPNTERAQLLRQRREATSRFHGFYEPTGAMAASHFVMDLTVLQREQLEIVLDEALGKHLLTEEERQSLKPKPEPARRRRARRTGETIENSVPPEAEVKPVPATPTLAPAAPPAPASGTEDPRDRLAQLLAKVPAEEIERQRQEEATAESMASQPMPELDFSRELPAGEENDSKKLEAVLRRIAICYYWGLIGAVRNGTFDGAGTCSQELGLIAAYNIVEGERFGKAFDDIFMEFEKQYPALYARCVRKDYLEVDGFRLTAVSLRLRDFLDTAPWGQFIPPDVVNREVRFVFGVSRDAVCFAVNIGVDPQDRLIEAMAMMETPLKVHDMFFWFSPYEIGQAIAMTGDPNRFSVLKFLAAGGHPEARAYAVSEFTDTTKTLTLRISGLMTPSIWRLRDNVRSLRY